MLFIVTFVIPIILPGRSTGSGLYLTASAPPGSLDHGEDKITTKHVVLKPINAVLKIHVSDI